MNEVAKPVRRSESTQRSIPDSSERSPSLLGLPTEARRRFSIDPVLRDQLGGLTDSRGEEALAEGAAHDYGLERAFRERAEPLFRFLFERYWRVTVDGLDNVPAMGGAILIGNHSGGLPFDATMVAYALSACAGGPRRIVRPLYDKFVEGLGPVRDAYRKLGGVPARYAVADELLSRGELPLIFPEGMVGVAKLYEDRYQVGEFSTSAARLSFRHRVPIIPFAVVGAEEIYPMIGRSSMLGKLVGAPYVPITPFFPALGLLGTVPLPTKWRIVFGSRVYLYREHRFRGPGAPDFAAMSDRLRRTVQILLRSTLAKRSSIFFG
jgi:1-acyl-sn-glycerol-3-phosphate acyltransferase